MSIVGSMSSTEKLECANCGQDSNFSANSLRLDNDVLAGTPSDTLARGLLYSRGETTLVCDVCLFAALRAAFGHLLVKKEGV